MLLCILWMWAAARETCFAASKAGPVTKTFLSGLRESIAIPLQPGRPASSSAADSRIQWVSCDAFTYQPDAKIDVVISSLFTHHLPDREIVHFLQWMEQVSARGWFVNDLRRAQTPYYAFKLLATAMRWHRFVQHDGPVSIRRSFTPCDWQRYITEAALDPNTVNIFDVWPARLCVARVK